MNTRSKIKVCGYARFSLSIMVKALKTTDVKLSLWTTIIRDLSVKNLPSCQIILPKLFGIESCYCVPMFGLPTEGIDILVPSVSSRLLACSVDEDFLPLGH